MSRSEPLPIWRAAAAIAASIALAGCVETALLEAREPFDYGAVLPEPPPGPSEGGIWPGAFPSGSFLSFDSKARGVGDLVTVEIRDQTRAVHDASTAAESDSTLGAAITSDVGFQSLISQPVRGLLRAIGIDGPGRDVAAGSQLNVASAQTTNEFEGTGTTERGGTFRATVTCRVVAALPGNLFHLRGRRAIVVNHELQYLTVEGLVRREDIGIDNTVPSTSLAEARITLDGLGVLDDKQRPGWMTRVFSWIYPF